MSGCGALAAIGLVHMRAVDAAIEKQVWIKLQLEMNISVCDWWPCFNVGDYPGPSVFGGAGLYKDLVFSSHFCDIRGKEIIFGVALPLKIFNMQTYSSERNLHLLTSSGRLVIFLVSTWTVLSWLLSLFYCRVALTFLVMLVCSSNVPAFANFELPRN